MIPSIFVMGFLGGVLIGFAALMYLLINGKIMGVSGILGGLLQKIPNSPASKTLWLERFAFVAGVVLTPLCLSFFIELPPTHATTSIGLLILAGLLVGCGTRLGSGCTSGHGVCGMARFSRRSMVATLSFIGAGVVTVFVADLIVGLMSGLAG